MFLRTASLVLLVGWLAPTKSNAEDILDELNASDFYRPKQEVSGQLQLAGSTTMQQLAALWADGFTRIHPQVQISIDCGGSETALTALAGNPSVIGLMSRPLLAKETEQLEKTMDGRVLELNVCHDALGLIVHKENPVAGLRLGLEGELLRTNDASVATTWGELGLTGDWSKRPIKLQGPSKQSGTRSFVDRLLAVGSNVGPSITEHATHGELMQAVATDRGSLGLVSLSRGASENVRLLPAGRAGEPPVEPTAEMIRARRYPLLRALSVLVVATGETLDEPLLEEFIAYLLSRYGQQDVLKDGFLPLSRSERKVQEDKLGWNRLQ